MKTKTIIGLIVILLIIISIGIIAYKLVDQWFNPEIHIPSPSPTMILYQIPTIDIDSEIQDNETSINEIDSQIQTIENEIQLLEEELNK